METFSSTHPQKIAVVGAGWAGLAAALTLHDAGYPVTVLEASRIPGGRARRLPQKGVDGPPLDNGQHILLGAYTETLACMRRLGRDPEQLFIRWPFSLASLDGSFRLAFPALPAPLHTLFGLLNAQGLSWRDRSAMLRFIYALRTARWETPAGETVATLFTRLRQPANLIQRLWEPLCLAALNTAPRVACAQLYANVLRDSLAGPAAATHLLLPRVDLSTLWPEAAAAQLSIRYGYSVRTVVPHQAGVTINGESYAAAVLAVPPPALARMLKEDTLATSTWAQTFSYSPIATLTLRLAAPWQLPQPMMMLSEAPDLHHMGQWLFDRAWLMGNTDQQGEITIVVSAATQLTNYTRNEIAQALIAQVCMQARANAQLAPMPSVTDWSLQVEKRATFLAVPGLHRPSQTTAWPHLTLAGDWTDTAYPGVLEGAVRSGRRAAHTLITACKR